MHTQAYYLCDIYIKGKRGVLYADTPLYLTPVEALLKNIEQRRNNSCTRWIALSEQDIPKTKSKK